MSVVTWRKSAARDVRPFFGAVALESCMERAEIRLYEDAPHVPEVAFVIESADVDRLAISIKPNLDLASLSFEGVKKSDLVVVVTASQSVLRKTRVVATHPLSSVTPPEIEIGPEVLAELGGGGNINVEVALCLARAQPKKPGSPFLLGHWLSKKTFALRRSKPAEDFDVSPMDDDGWVKRGLPAKTPTTSTSSAGSTSRRPRTGNSRGCSSIRIFIRS